MMATGQSVFDDALAALWRGGAGRLKRQKRRYRPRVGEEVRVRAGVCDPI